MKKCTLFLLLAIFLNTEADASIHGDLILLSGVDANIKVKIISVPFEGLNRDDFGSISPYNRVGIALNGEFHRRFSETGNSNDFRILTHYAPVSNATRLASAFAEITVIDTDYYGFAKYLITFENINKPALSMSIIWNTLDSKMGLGEIFNGYYYRGDWTVSYNELSSSDAQISIENQLNPHVNEIVNLSQSGKEIKLWKLIYDRDEPWERKFYARTIPFPVRNTAFNPEEGYPFYEFILGTTVIFDTVYPKFDDPVLGDTNRYGYNTLMTTEYYTNPIIPVSPVNERGNHLLTPGVISNIHYPNNIFSAKITATAGDTLIISDNKHFWVNGTDNYWDDAYYGDTLIFEPGSQLTLKNDASLRAMNNGNIIDKGGSKSFAPGAFVSIKRNSYFIIDGTNVTYPANTRIEVEADGYLILKDNATLIFDGEGAHLDIHPEANLVLGENSKIEFRNGAYFDAEDIIFEGNNGAIWDGLVFHNAGGQTQVKNCTFKDAKIAIVMQILKRK